MDVSVQLRSLQHRVSISLNNVLMQMGTGNHARAISDLNVALQIIQDMKRTIIEDQATKKITGKK